MDHFLVVVAIFLGVLDGIATYYFVSKREKKQKKDEARQRLELELLFADLDVELHRLKEFVGNVCYPQLVLARRGFTGRGSPFLTRNRYTLIESVEKSIKRIIK